MRVLLGHCFYRTSAPSGEDSVYRNEKKMLESNGIEVIPFEKQNDDLEGLDFFGKVRSGFEYVWSKNAFQETTKLIDQYKPDLAHFHNIFPQMSTSVHAACKTRGIPVVQTLHNFRFICPSALLQRNNAPCDLCVKGSLMNSIKHRCYRDSVVATLPLASMITVNRAQKNFENNVNTYIALTEFSKQQFASAGLPAEKLTVKPNFVHNTNHPEFNLGDYILYVGRLTQEKGVLSLIEACKNLKNIPLKIVGDGGLRRQLEDTVISEKLNVEILGYRNNDEVLSLLDGARFLVLPSECYEGFPVTICEAFSRKKIVVGSRIGNIDAIIQEGGDMSTVISEMWQDTKNIQLMSETAYAEYQQRYNPESNHKQLMAIYNQLLSPYQASLSNI